MSLLLAAAFAFAVNGRQTPPASWTWTLYEGDGPVVLANEVPDTANLRVTLQCASRSSVIDITVYDEVSPAPQTSPAAPPPAGFARLTSGSASATSETRASRAERLAVTLRTDHPVFASFVGSGDLTVMSGDRTRTVKIERPHLAKLRRFADRCAG